MSYIGFSRERIEVVPVRGSYVLEAETGDPTTRPGPGNVRVESGPPVELVVDRFDRRLADSELELVEVGWKIYLTSSGKWSAYTVTSVVAEAGFWRFEGDLDPDLSPPSGAANRPVPDELVQIVAFPSYLLTSDYVAPTLGLRNQLETRIRYADPDQVAERIGLDAPTPELEQAIRAAELAIDEFLARSLPDPQPFGEWSSIPDTLIQAAENVSLAIYKATDAPAGVLGSDEFLGELDLTEVARREIRRSPTLLGLKRGFGVA